MNEQEGPEWFSGVVSNSTASANQMEGGPSGNNTTAGRMSSNNASATRAADETHERDAALLHHLTQLLGSFSLSGRQPHSKPRVAGDEGASQNVAGAPIFFSTRMKAPGGGNPTEPTSVATAEEEPSGVSYDEAALADKIKAMLREGLHSSSHTSTEEHTQQSDGNSSTNSVNDKEATSRKRPVPHYPMPLSNRPEVRPSENLPQDQSAFELLKNKAQAQELLIGRLYSDLLQAEERLSQCVAAKAQLDKELSAKSLAWERERSEWERECSKLASERQTHVKEAARGSLESPAESPLRFAPLSPFVGFDGSRKAYVSLHEELHYTKGHNTALRAQLAKQAAELEAKDAVIARLGAQLREAYRAKEPVIEVPTSTRRHLCLQNHNGQETHHATQKALPSSIAAPLSDAQIVEVLRRVVARGGKHSNIPSGQRPRPRSSSAGSRRTSSPFRTTHIL